MVVELPFIYVYSFRHTIMQSTHITGARRWGYWHAFLPRLSPNHPIYTTSSGVRAEKSIYTLKNVHTHTHTRTHVPTVEWKNMFSPMWMVVRQIFQFDILTYIYMDTRQREMIDVVRFIHPNSPKKKRNTPKNHRQHLYIYIYIEHIRIVMWDGMFCWWGHSTFLWASQMFGNIYILTASHRATEVAHGKITIYHSILKQEHKLREGLMLGLEHGNEDHLRGTASILRRFPFWNIFNQTGRFLRRVLWGESIWFYWYIPYTV